MSGDNTLSWSGRLAPTNDHSEDAMTTTGPIAPSHDELNVSPRTAELIAAVDDQDDGDKIAEALVVAILALTDISGDDPLRPSVAQPAKVARRSLARILEFVED